MFDPNDIHGSPKLKKSKKEEISLNLSTLKEQSRVNNGIEDVFGSLYGQLNLDTSIVATKQDKKWNESLKSCVMARIMQPCSKKKTVETLNEKMSTILNLDHVYRLMDHVAEKEEQIKQCVSSVSQTLLKEKVDILLFDVTTLYFESTKADELRGFGFSKDCKFNQTQVVLALTTTREGLPINYELFPGNTSEGSTLVNTIIALKSKYDIDQVVLVAD
jgi:transposase